MITLASTVKPPESVLFRELAGEGVLLELESGRYFGLNETGTRMWSLLVEHGQVEPALRALVQEYDVPMERLRGELLGFISLLAGQRLLHVVQA